MRTVLVAEDNTSQREMLTALLRKHGFAVVSVQDGQEALAKLKEYLPDLLILDVIMPKMNGYEVCRKLREDPATAKLPIVLCSSKGEDFDVNWGLRQGASAYVCKPFAPQELIRTVLGLLPGSLQQS